VTGNVQLVAFLQATGYVGSLQKHRKTSHQTLTPTHTHIYTHTQGNPQ